MSAVDLPPPTRPADDRVRQSESPDRDVVATPDTLFGLSFDSASRAQQFMLAIKGLDHDHKLKLADAVLVVKGDDQHVRVHETIDPQAGRSAMSGAMWTGLLGLILGGPVGWIAGIGIGAGVGVVAAKVIDLGIPDEWVDWFKDAVRPDTATVLVLASDIDQRALGAEVDRFPNVRLVHATIRTEAFSQLRSAFNDLAPTEQRDDDV
jgi:uncharacterized membrane protein